MEGGPIGGPRTGARKLCCLQNQSTQIVHTLSRDRFTSLRWAEEDVTQEMPLAGLDLLICFTNF
jgi:hypothetical protein